MVGCLHDEALMMVMSLLMCSISIHCDKSSMQPAISRKRRRSNCQLSSKGDAASCLLYFVLTASSLEDDGGGVLLLVWFNEEQVFLFLLQVESRGGEGRGTTPKVCGGRVRANQRIRRYCINVLGWLVGWLVS